MAGATAVVVTAVMMELEVVRVEEKDRSLFAHMAGAVVLVAATVKVAVTEMVTAEEKAEEKGTAAVKVAVVVGIWRKLAGQRPPMRKKPSKQLKRQFEVKRILCGLTNEPNQY